MKVEPDTYQRAKSIFFEASERPHGERDAYVQTACAGDEALRSVVQRLLSSDDDPLSLTHAAPVREQLKRLANIEGSGEEDFAPSEVIGRYRILEVLGRGGMGVVYLAEQENPRRQVALKVLAPGQVSPASLRRFEHEAQVLGRLHHPGIAQIFEAGTHDPGHGAQPFFAMEYVCGQPLLDHCDEHRADVRTRLELFIAICDAVGHAHEQGVIHRDLKPGNILVTGTGSHGRGAEDSASHSRAASPLYLPKILDFGVARLTDSDLQITTMHTAADQFIGTLAYMSPEQMSGTADSVDARSDIFSLGVILFQLLAGRLPHDLTDKTVPETIRIIGQEEPVALSVLNRQFRGDLETIAGKALERDRNRRYQSVGELADDVRRFLSHEPIHARPPSSLYQLRKLARRHRALVGGVITVFLVLIAGIITTAWQARQAIAARDLQIELREKASLTAAQNVAVNRFLRGMLSSARPDVTLGHELTVAEVLDAAAFEIDAQPAQPDVECMIRLTIGESYLAVGKVAKARVYVEQALRLARSEHGDSSAEVATALVALASVLNTEGDYQSAIASDEQALAMFGRAHHGDHIDVASTLSNLADHLSNAGDRERARAVRSESLEMLRRLYGDDNVDVADSQARLAAMLHNPGDAEPLLRAALATYDARVGQPSPKYIQVLRQLAGLMVMRRDYDNAIASYLEVIRLGAIVFGENHPKNLSAISDMGFCYQMAGRPDDMVATYTRAAEMAKIVYSEDSMVTVEAIMDLADARNSAGDYEGSLADHRLALATARRIGKDKDARACVGRLSIGSLLLRLDRESDFAEVATLSNEVLAITQDAPPEQQWMIGRAKCLLGRVALKRGNFPEAELLLNEGFEKIGPGRLVAHHRRAAASSLVNLYETWHAAFPGMGKDQLAAQWRTKLQELTPKPPEKAATAPVKP